MDDRASESGAWHHPEADARGQEADTLRSLAPAELVDLPVPTTALELDALLRHLEIDGEFADWANAAEHFSKARAVWQLLQGPLAGRLETRRHLTDAVQASQGMGRVVERLRESIERCAGEDVAWLARRAIHLVEAIERALE